MISLGGGYPNPSTFIFESVSLSVKGSSSPIRLVGDELVAASQYGPSLVDLGLQPLLRQWHEAKGGPAVEDGGLAVLNGSQEGLFIAAYLLLEAGDTVVVSEPTYPGAISAFSAFEATYLAVPLDGEGIDCEALAAALDERRSAGQKPPKFIYNIPNGHNPGGVTSSLARRKRLLDIATEHDLLVIEDDPYQLLWYDDEPATSLQELDEEGRVLRLDSFSKIFVPGLRVGYLTAAPDVVRQFELYKQSANLHTSSFCQRILAAYLAAEGPAGLEEHIATSRTLYARNRDAMVEAARTTLPAGVTFDVPGSGLFIWFRLPEGVNAARMHDRFTESHKVLLVPGAAFSTSGGCGDCMRASFSTVAPERIGEGVARFARMLEDEMAGGSGEQAR